MAVLHHSEAGAPGDPAVLLLHGYPQSSHLWRHVLPRLADAGLHALAPDLAGFGKSPPRGPGTWERQVENVAAFVAEQGLERVALVMHDWGALVGLWWACEHSDSVSALAISSSGFFPDGKWHGIAAAMRTPGQGEEMVARMTREGFTELLAGVSRGIGPEDAAEYFGCFADEERRAGQLELYRSGDFEKLERFDGCLEALDVPALILWGADDPFSPVAGAHRFATQLPRAELVVLEGAGHFVIEDEPEAYARHLERFLAGALLPAR